MSTEGTSEKTAKCILGNGYCPPVCPKHRTSISATKAAGDNFDPQLSRLGVIFADAFNHKINVLDISDVLANCVNEKPPREVT